MRQGVAGAPGPLAQTVDEVPIVGRKLEAAEVLKRFTERQLLPRHRRGDRTTSPFLSLSRDSLLLTCYPTTFSLPLPPGLAQLELLFLRPRHQFYWSLLSECLVLSSFFLSGGVPGPSGVYPLRFGVGVCWWGLFDRVFEHNAACDVFRPLTVISHDLTQLCSRRTVSFRSRTSLRAVFP